MSSWPHGGRAGPRSGHAIELRINAEDPVARLRARARDASTRFRPPLGPGVRVDTFVEEGTTISPYYDSLIAKLIVKDGNRRAGDRAGALRALTEFEIVGVPDDARGAAGDLDKRRVPQRRVLDVIP